jgi:hypothetical protein
LLDDNVDCQAPTGTTVAPEPELRPETVALLPGPLLEAHGQILIEAGPTGVRVARRPIWIAVDPGFGSWLDSLPRLGGA